MAQVRASQGDFVWTTIPSPEKLERQRLAAMATFLVHYESGRRQGRSVAGEAQAALPFIADAFDLALSSHVLLLDALAADFLAPRLPRARWTHQAHLALALLLRNPQACAEAPLRHDSAARLFSPEARGGLAGARSHPPAPVERGTQGRAVVVIRSPTLSTSTLLFTTPSTV
jgi:hypothetical protein